MSETLAVGVATLVVGLVALWLAKGMLEGVTALWGFYHEHRMYLEDSVIQSDREEDGADSGISERMTNMTWEPVIDSRGFDRDQDGNVYAYCRAVPAEQWSQGTPTEPGDYRIWQPGWVQAMFARFWLFQGVLVTHNPVNGSRMKALDIPHGTWYCRIPDAPPMPATVPQRGEAQGYE